MQIHAILIDSLLLKLAHQELCCNSGLMFSISLTLQKSCIQQLEGLWWRQHLVFLLSNKTGLTLCESGSSRNLWEVRRNCITVIDFSRIETSSNNSMGLSVFLQSILRHVHTGGSGASNQNGLYFIQTLETK